MNVVLHSCCGPCASACVPRLKGEGHRVAMFFSNSNIDTREEYERRLEAARKLAAAEGVTLVADAYDHADWLREVAAGYESEPERGRRCARCYRYNLARTAAYAAANGFEAFTTSLTVSPHKPSEKIFAAWGEPPSSAVGSAREGARPPVFLREDFKKKDGFKLSVKRAAELGLYRQAYCGCEFSKRRMEERT